MTPRALKLLIFAGALSLSAPLSAQSINVGPGGSGGGVNIRPDSSSVDRLAQPAQGAGQVAGDAGGEFNSDIVSNVYNFSDISDPNQAFRGLALPVQRLYRGVLPGIRDTLPHIRRFQLRGLRARSNQLTWVGYQRMPDKSRVFLQTFDSPSFEVLRGNQAGQLIIVLKDTRIPLTNFRRVMDARWIPRSVASIRARTRGRDVHVNIQMRRRVEFALSVDGPYLNIDFDDAFLEAEVGGDKPNPNEGNVLDDPNAGVSLR